jgi:hypothetical protein
MKLTFKHWFWDFSGSVLLLIVGIAAGSTLAYLFFILSLIPVVWRIVLRSKVKKV